MPVVWPASDELVSDSEFNFSLDLWFLKRFLIEFLDVTALLDQLTEHQLKNLKRQSLLGKSSVLRWFFKSYIIIRPSYDVSLFVLAF